MSENRFVTYQKFNELSQANELTDLLKQNNIEFVVEDYSISFDPSFANNETDREYRIKIKKEDFEVADQLVNKITAEEIKSVDEDYYLYEFTDQELIEVVVKSEEWSRFDYLLAQKLLKERGKEINKDLLDGLKHQRIEDLAKPEESQKIWIIAGYIFAFLGGLLGIFIGWHLLSHKKTLPNGDRVHGYSTDDRKHGNRILIIAITFFVFWTILKILV